jgi:L-asparaginase II
MRKLAIKTRGNLIETIHHGFLCLVDATGKLDKVLNDKESFFVRSCIKPIQAKVCKDILKDSLRNEYLTMAVASHNASNEQLELLTAMLNFYGVDESELYCGLHSTENKKVINSKIHHNCAGKHIAQIAAGKKMGFSSDYQSNNHELQLRILEELKRLSGLETIITAIDGCGLPTFYLSIEKLAQMFTRTSLEKNYLDIYRTVNQYASLISGKGKFDQELMLHAPNKFFTKSGADGLMVILNLETKETLVIKIADGEKRVKDIVAKKILEDLNWIKPNSLNIDQNIYSSQGHIVGALDGFSSLK